MYKDGQLEQELKVLKSVVAKLGNVNSQLSTIQVNRTFLVVAIADLTRELERRQKMMAQYLITGEF